jgi:hypothetical protein
LTTIWNFIMVHQTIAVLVVYYVVSAFVGSLPAPRASSSQIYLFFYKFANTLGGNLTRAFATKVEGSPNFQDAVNQLPGPVNKPVVVVEAPKVS